MSKYLTSLFIVAIFFSCASSYQIEKISTASTETQARIVVVRSSIAGAVNHANVYVDNNFVGKVGATSYLAWDVEPGLKTLRSSKGYFKVNAKAGETYYLLLKPKLSFSLTDANYEFDLLTEKEGERRMAHLSKPAIKNS